MPANWCIVLSDFEGKHFSEIHAITITKSITMAADMQVATNGVSEFLHRWKHNFYAASKVAIGNWLIWPQAREIVTHMSTCDYTLESLYTYICVCLKVICKISTWFHICVMYFYILVYVYNHNIVWDTLNRETIENHKFSLKTSVSHLDLKMFNYIAHSESSPHLNQRRSRDVNCE